MSTVEEAVARLSEQADTLAAFNMGSQHASDIRQVLDVLTAADDAVEWLKNERERLSQRVMDLRGEVLVLQTINKNLKDRA